MSSILKFEFDEEEIEFQGNLTNINYSYFLLLYEVAYSQAKINSISVVNCMFNNQKISPTVPYYIIFILVTLVDKFFFETKIVYDANGIQCVIYYSCYFLPGLLFYRLIMGNLIPAGKIIGVQIIIFLGLIISSLICFYISDQFLVRYILIAILIIISVWLFQDLIILRLQIRNIYIVEIIISILLSLTIKSFVIQFCVKQGFLIFQSITKNVFALAAMSLILGGYYLIHSIFIIQPQGIILHLEHEISLDHNKINEEILQKNLQESSIRYLLLLQVLTHIIFNTLLCTNLYYLYQYIISNDILSASYCLIVLVLEYFNLILVKSIKSCYQQIYEDFVKNKIYLYLISVLSLVPAVLTLVINYYGNFLTNYSIYSINGYLIVSIIITHIQVTKIYQEKSGLVRFFVFMNLFEFPYGFFYLFGTINNMAQIKFLGLVCALLFLLFYFLEYLYYLILYIKNNIDDLVTLEALKRFMLTEVIKMDHYTVNNIIYFLIVEGILISLIPSLLNQNATRISYYYYSLIIFILMLYVTFALIDIANNHEKQCRYFIIVVLLFQISGAFVWLFMFKTITLQTLYPFLLQIVLSYLIFELGILIKSIAKKYEDLKNFLLLNLIYLLLILPFFIILPIGFIIFPNLNEYYFNWVMSMFIFISIMVAQLGFFVHLILNLTEVNLKNLFILKQMKEWMSDMNIMQNDDKIMVIAAIFQKQSKNIIKFFEFLKTEKVTKIITHDNVKVLEDYEFVNPDTEIITTQLRRKTKKLLTIEPGKIASLNQDSANTIMHQKEEERQKIKSINMKWMPKIQQSKITKNNILVTKGTHLYEISTNSYQLCVTLLCRLFFFLSQPNKLISFEDFKQFLLAFELIDVYNDNDSEFKKYFMPHSNDQFTIDIQGYRKLMLSIIGELYNEDSNEAVTKFTQGHIFMKIYLTAEEQLFYLMFRREIDIKQYEMIWSVQYMENQKNRFLLKQKQQKQKKLDLMFKVDNLDSEIKIMPTKLDRKNNKKKLTQLTQKNQEILEEPENKFYQKKNIQFKKISTIYMSLAKRLLEVYEAYQKRSNEIILLESFSWKSFGNLISIVTKISDFVLAFLWVPITTFYQYYNNNLNLISPTNFTFQIQYVFIAIVICVLLYFFLLIFHKNQFRDGNLGLDQFKQKLTLTNIKYYSTKLLFVLGTSLTSTIINNFINMLLCTSKDNITFYLIADQSTMCFSIQHITYIMSAAIVLISYYPLALIIFPYSSSIDSSKQIKYKSEFEVIYMQSKLILGGLIVIYSTQVESSKLIIIDFSGFLLCTILLVLFYKTNPCSIRIINSIELHCYSIIAWINLWAFLCHYISYMVSGIVCLSGILIYIVMLIMIHLRRKQNYDNNAKNDNFDILMKQKKQKQKIMKRLFNEKEPRIGTNEPISEVQQKKQEQILEQESIQ